MIYQRYGIQIPTAEEVAILRLLAQGKTYKEIAWEIGIETGTIHSRIHRLFTKLRVRSGTAAVVLATLIGYVQLPERPFPRPRITKRQREVLRLAACGHLYPEMAARLGVSVSGVRSRLFQAKLKLGTANMTESVMMAIAAGVVQLPEVEEIIRVRREQHTQQKRVEAPLSHP